jgi:hypothetical protein
MKKAVLTLIAAGLIAAPGVFAAWTIRKLQTVGRTSRSGSIIKWLT